MAYLSFERPDLSLAERFLLDFGLRVAAREEDAVYFRALGRAPYCCVARRGPSARFVGLGLVVSSDRDLESLRSRSATSAIEAVPGPGGGTRVSLRDPAGFVVDAVYGRETVDPLHARSPMLFNAPGHAARVNEPQHPPHAPPDVHKLGHVVLEVPALQETSAWYTENFGFVPSDVQVLPDGSPAVAFLRLDLGSTPTDHHTLAIAQSFAPRLGHCAYEVTDVDAVAMGHRLLRERGWHHAWGLGRHILGSQVFDYWSDPWGTKHEHYCDGDVFTSDVDMGVHEVSRDAMSQWGPPMPRSFTKPQLSPKSLLELVRNVRQTPELTPRRLFELFKVFG